MGGFKYLRGECRVTMCEVGFHASGLHEILEFLAFVWKEIADCSDWQQPTDVVSKRSVGYTTPEKCLGLGIAN